MSIFAAFDTVFANFPVTVIVSGVMILLIRSLIWSYFWMIRHWDPDCRFQPENLSGKVLWGVSIMTGLWIGIAMKRWGIEGQLICGFLAAYLLTASFTDLQTREVYDFLPMVTALVGGGYLLYVQVWEKVPALTLFIFIQYLFFLRMYGKADAHAFVVCAIFESRFGVGLFTYLLHMGAAVALMGLIQLLRHNVSRTGNLREPVPFLPYIAVTVWCFL